MAIPDYQALMLPVLRMAAASDTTLPACVKQISREYALTPTDLEQTIKSGTQTLIYNRVAWAKTYLAKAGLLDSPKRGVFRASSAGSELLSRNPSQIDTDVLREYEAFRKWSSRSSRSAGASEPEQKQVSSNTPEEQMDDAYAVIEDALREEIIQRLTAAKPSFFERVILDVVVALGFGGSREDAARHVGRAGDRGVDGVIDQDALGLDSIYLQAKRYDVSRTVGPAEIREFSGALVGRGANKGVFVTTSSFSKAAMDFAAELRHQRIVLIDGDELAGLMIEHDVGLRTAKSYLIKKVDLDYYEEAEDAET